MVMPQSGQLCLELYFFFFFGGGVHDPSEDAFL